MKKVELKIQTKEKRKFFGWSCLGIICAGIWLSILTSNPIPSESTSPTFHQMTEDLIFQGLLIGCLGVLLLLSSIIRYYFRLGIVPGIYHSTICIPKFESDNFSFSISPSFFFCISSSILLMILSAILTFTLNLYKTSQLSLLHVSSHSSILVLLYNWSKKNDSKIQEISGITLMVLSSYLLYLDSSFLEFSIEVHGISFLVIFLNFFTFLAFLKAQERLDGHSIAIVSLVFYGIFAFLGFLVLFFNENFSEFDLNLRFFEKSLALGVFFYCFCRCEGNEVSLLLCYLLFSVFISNQGEFWLKIAVLTGEVLGSLIVVLGDLPCAAFKNWRNESKSELHSPLLI